MQAIQTKITKPTNAAGSRVVAKCAAGSIRVGYDHELSVEFNHRAAAVALCVKLGWTVDKDYCPLESGGMADGSYVHVFSESAKAVLLVRIGMLDGSLSGNPHCKPWGRAVAALTDNDANGSGYLAADLDKMTARLAKSN